jgi:CBS domain-containing protein
MLVHEVMSRKLITLKPDDVAYTAVKLMISNKISGLLVLEEGKAVGVVTMKDVFKNVLLAEKNVHETPVRDIMSKPVLSVHPLKRIEKAAEAMSRHHVKRLAVMDDNKNIMGIITAMDIVSKIPELIDVMFKTWVKPQWR